jgi:hypothetical protein
MNNAVAAAVARADGGGGGGGDVVGGGDGPANEMDAQQAALTCSVILFEEMRSGGLSPPVEVYESLVRSFIAFENMPGAVSIVDTMTADGASKDELARVFDILLASNAACDAVADAQSSKNTGVTLSSPLSIFDDMISRGLEPSTVRYVVSATQSLRVTCLRARM